MGRRYREEKHLTVCVDALVGMVMAGASRQQIAEGVQINATF